MERLQYEIKVNQLLDEAREIEKKEQIGLNAAIFLDNKVKQLEKIIDNPQSTEEELQNASEKLEKLFNRVELELKYAHSNDGDLLRIEKELEILNNRFLVEGLT